MIVCACVCVRVWGSVCAFNKNYIYLSIYLTFYIYTYTQREIDR